MTTHYTERAEARLVSIAVYTLAIHGSTQRNRYLRMLREVCNELLPSRWKRISQPDPKFPEFQRYRAGHHFIYFRVLADGLEIVDILHEKQLPAKQLRDLITRHK